MKKIALISAFLILGGSYAQAQSQAPQKPTEVKYDEQELLKVAEQETAKLNELLQLSEEQKAKILEVNTMLAKKHAYINQVAPDKVQQFLDEANMARVEAYRTVLSADQMHTYKQSLSRQNANQ